jgi:hypothetical protein
MCNRSQPTVDIPRFLNAGRTKIDTAKSLQDLDGQDWGTPQYGTYLEVECPRLRRVPLRELSPGGIATLIQQDIGSRYLMPLALLWLASDPLLEGEYYAGDLLEQVLRLPAAFWVEHPAWERQIRALVQQALERLAGDSCARASAEITGVEEKFRRWLGGA